MDNPQNKTGQQSSKLKIVGIAIAGVIVIVVAWYFLYFTKTPEYALNQVRESVVNHDVATFKKYVDLDSLLKHAYDDAVTVAISRDEQLAKHSAAIGALAKLFQDPLVAEGKNMLLRYVETGKFDAGNSTPSNKPQSDRTPDANNILEKTKLKGAKFAGIAYLKKEKDTANIGVKFLVSDTNQELIVDGKLRKLNNGSWQIVEITNLKELLLQADKMNSKK